MHTYTATSGKGAGRVCGDDVVQIFVILFLRLFIYFHSRYAFADDATITTHNNNNATQRTKTHGPARWRQGETFPIFVQTTKRLSLMKRYVSSRVHFSFFSLFIRFSFVFFFFFYCRVNTQFFCRSSPKLVSFSSLLGYIWNGEKTPVSLLTDGHPL